VRAALGDAFQLESEMASGGMSRLFLASEASLDRKVVVKVLPPELTSEVSAARFRQEAGLLAKLQHPHILPILQIGSHEGLIYYIMPFVAGESLRHRLEKGERFEVEEAVRIVGEVADALGFAHACGVLHRDIKPENILLEGRHAVLADFGVARALEQLRTGERLTREGASVGTPLYMSPEQVAGEEIDGRADVYALAVVAYELLAGHPPFRGPSAQSVMAAHLTTPPLPLIDVRPEVPERVSSAVARALSKDAGDRYQTALDFRNALEGRRGAEDAAPRARWGGRWWAVASAVAAGVLGWIALSPGSATIDPLTLAALRTAADSGRIDEIAVLIDGAGVGVDDASVSDVVRAFTGSIRVDVTPAGAALEVKRVEPMQSFPERSYHALHAGGAAELLGGEYLIRAAAAGYQDRLLLAHVAQGSEVTVAIELLPAGAELDGKTRVTGGPSPVGDAVEAFLIGRTEVTNEQYMSFMSAGGYRDAALWPERMLLGDEEMGWSEAIQRLVDRTGLAGPRGWENGRFPPGRGEHPVTGVTWYEAGAYARWAEGELPPAAQWWRAAMADSARPYPWGAGGGAAHLRANLEGVDTAPAGAYVLGVSPFGVLDMAGNAREWLGDPATDDGRRRTAGGSWQEPLYTASPEWMTHVPPDHATDALGFRVLWRQEKPR